ALDQPVTLRLPAASRHAPLPKRATARGGGCSRSLPHDTATTAIYTLSLHDALPIFSLVAVGGKRTSARVNIVPCSGTKKRGTERSEERSAGMPRPISYAVFCLKKKKDGNPAATGQPDKAEPAYDVGGGAGGPALKPV